MKNIKARDIMNKNIKTVKPETTIKELAAFFLKHQISGAPVMNDNEELIRIVTEGDLIFRDANVHLPTVVTLFDSIFYLESPHKYEHELQKIIGGKTEDIMTKDVVTVEMETDMTVLATIMHEKKCHLLPVMDQGKLVGIIGKADMVKAISMEETFD